jgi:ABC-type phosphate transport system auxiliary subunit
LRFVDGCGAVTLRFAQQRYLAGAIRVSAERGRPTAMTGQPTLKQVLDRMNRAITTMEEAMSSRAEQDVNYAEAEEEVQRLNSDRSRLAGELDNSEARGERLTAANKEVSRRLVTAMETIRAVLDR